jgi:hypothetical protein
MPHEDPRTGDYKRHPSRSVGAEHTGNLAAPVSIAWLGVPTRRTSESDGGTRPRVSPIRPICRACRPATGAGPEGPPIWSGRCLPSEQLPQAGP